VYNYLESAITAGTGSCIYISGTPGTGKTATVREVIASLSGAVEAEELDDFIFVEINGMKVTDPHQSYSLLWEALTGDRLSPTHALGLLEREFSSPSPRRVPCVVLMDELDQLVTKNQSVMYNFFNWPGLRHSRLIVLAVANTMDLPERTLSNKISSRLGLTRITFPGYTHEQLIQIISSRLADVPGKLVEADAIQFASRKVAQVSGDARRALDICRRAVEIAEQDSNTAITTLTPAALKSGRHISTLETIPGSDDEEGEDGNAENIDPTPDSPSKRGRRKHASPPPLLARTPAKKSSLASKEAIVTIPTIQRAIREATTSPLQIYLRHLPLASKVFLAALVARARRSGIAECVVGDVVDEAGRLAGMSAVKAVSDLLTVFDASGIAAQSELTMEGNDGNRRRRIGGANVKTRVKKTRVYAMGAAAAELNEAGIVVLEARGGLSGNLLGERMAKIRLNVGEEEVRLAFREDDECTGLGFASS
jgi:origin recognition complex subunit 1